MNRKRLFLAIRIVLAAGLLGGIFLTVKPREIGIAFLQADFRLVLAGAALLPLNVYLREYKWRCLVRLVKPDVTRAETWGSLLGGFALGIVTPGRIGEYGRVMFIKNLSPLKLIGLTVIDKFYNLGCTIAFGLPALLTLPWALNFFQGGLFLPLLGLLFLMDALLLYLALDPRPVRSLIYALQMMAPRQGRIAQLLGGLDRFNHPQARLILVLTLAHYLVFLAQYTFLINGFCRLAVLPSSQAAAAVLFAKSALPIAIGDLGIDQLVSMQFFSEFGVPETAALNASLLLFAFNVLLPALAGIPFISRLQIGANPNGAAS
ncbi:MAG: lysylphosphatidylglycerol synthase transmembrane domain-containing protein [Calditrichota bacterium]